jgi:hypothetical protein
MERLLQLLDKAVDIWHEFLDSLATIGGNIMILVSVWALTGYGVVHVLHHADASSDAKSLILSTFAGVNGALMYALTQRQRGGNGNGDFSKPTPQQEPTKKEAVNASVTPEPDPK